MSGPAPQSSRDAAPAPQADLRSITRRRRVLFGAMAFLLAAGLASFGGVSLRGSLEVPEWTDYLGENERTSLFAALTGESGDKARDPAVRVPGFRVLSAHEFRTKIHEGGAYDVRWDEGRSEEFKTALEAVAAHWHSMDFKVRYEGMRVSATPPGDEKLYVASVTGEDESGRTVVKISSLRVDPKLGTGDPAERPAEYAELLPPIPPDSAYYELGRPGEPGYALMIDLRGPPESVFAAVRADLERRGWSPLDLGSAGRPAVGPADGHSGVFRHKTAPLGLHLMAKPHASSIGVSQVYLGVM